MKEGWIEVALGELATISSGKSNTKDAVVDGDFIFFDRSKTPKRSSRYLFDKSALIVPGEGKEFHPRKFTGKFDLHQRAYAIFDFRPDVIRDFVFYALENDHKRFEREAVGATVKSLRQRHFDKFPIPLPPLKEQRHIVAVLDKAFDALDLARENVKTNLALSKSFASLVFDQMLSNLKQTTWVELQDFCHDFEYGTSSKSALEGLVPVLRMGNIQNGAVDWANLKFSINDSDNKKYSLKNGDVLFNRTNSPEHVGKSAIYRGKREAIFAGYLVRVLYDLSKIDGEFLNQFLNGEVARNYGKTVMSKSVNQANISAGKLKKYPFPNLSLEQQRKISNKVFSVRNASENLFIKYSDQLSEIDNLRQSLLEQAFAGKLNRSNIIIASNDNEEDMRLSAATLCFAYDKHCIEQQQNTFGHVKAQKTLHLTESIAGLDLGRQPMVRQAGPHDQEHFNRVEAWAAENEIFKFQQRRTGQRGYDFVRGRNYDSFLIEAKTLLADHKAGLSRFLPLITQMNTEEAEVFTTVHAAWNNLRADGETLSDDKIIYAAREGWHESKLDIARSKFSDAIRTIRQNDLTPDGSAKYVHGAQESLI